MQDVLKKEVLFIFYVMFIVLMFIFLFYLITSRFIKFLKKDILRYLKFWIIIIV